MYNHYFGFRENPFSIAPDPRYLYMSEMHQDALAHLDFGASSDGCIILLTGEIGTGKTTICRCFLERLEPTAEVAVIINPGLTATELLATVCDEFKIATKAGEQSGKYYIDQLNQFLLASYSENRKTLLVIDEAQNLDKEALETLRLLTNLETNQRKLLKIFLLGQSELSTVLAGPDLTQISQRITGRFHLKGLQAGEIDDYIGHRIAVAGGGQRRLFGKKAVKRIHQLTGGIPRLINTLCDRSLLGAYSEGKEQVDEAIVKKAGQELFGHHPAGRTIEISLKTLVATTVSLVLILAVWVGTTNDLFHLNLDSILGPPALTSVAPRQDDRTDLREPPAESVAADLAQTGDEEMAGPSAGAGAQTSLADEKAVALADSEPVVSALHDAQEVTKPVEVDPADRGPKDISQKDTEPAAMISPPQALAENPSTPQQSGTRIVIKTIEISE